MRTRIDAGAWIGPTASVFRTVPELRELTACFEDLLALIVSSDGRPGRTRV